MQNFNILASLCSGADCFEACLTLNTSIYDSYTSYIQIFITKVFVAENDDLSSTS